MQHQAISSQKTTVLVVDDDPICLRVVIRALEEQGYNVMSASSGKAALDLCTSTSCAIDVVLTDVFMPDIGGIELAEKIQKSCPNISFFFMTGYLNKAVDLHWEQGQQLMNKPINPKELHDMIDVQVNISI